MHADDKPVDEKLCTNCGKCCYMKVIIGRTVFITPFPCEFLDTNTNLCTIYDRRHELNPLCLSVKEGMKVSAFPEDCPYVPEHAPKNYKPARDGWQWKDEWHDFDSLADDLDVSMETRERVRVRGSEAEPMYVETFARIQQQRAEQASANTAALLWGNSPVVIQMAHEPPPQAGEIPALADLVRQKKSPGDKAAKSSAQSKDEGRK
jgi:uncharacterized protein